VAAAPNVCLESMRRKTDGGGRRKIKKICLQHLCYTHAKGIGGNLLDNGVACPGWGLMAKQGWDDGNIRIGGGNRLLR